MEWYLQVWRKYAVFDGRTNRPEFWMFQLFNWLAGFALWIVTLIIHPLGFLVGLYGLAVIIPTLALQVRRLHDTNRSGWWIFINLVPVVGGIVLFVFDVLPGDWNDNNYGPRPSESPLV